MTANTTENEFLESFHNGNCFNAYEFFGCHPVSDREFVFRVWAPHAKSVTLVGNFCGKADLKLPMLKLSDCECFEVRTTAELGDVYQYLIETYDGRTLLKNDPYAFKSDFPNSFKSVIYKLPESSFYRPPVETPIDEQPVNIYEVNLLSWKRHQDKTYYSYSELESELVPYVKEMGYTHVEFMPLTEFPYDGSWGYQVTGYFAVTSRLGTPEEFLSLVKAFHKSGIKVILDWVPAHFPKDDWGLYEFDGQPLYESPLWDRMEHSGWGTRKFDFGRGEVESFLLSSACFFAKLCNIDGLRVDAVASMIYLDYDKPSGDFTPNRFGDNRNLEAIDFIKKFNVILKNNFPNIITIAEESTAFGGVTDKPENGGLGFDFKWNMGWMNDVLFYCKQDPYFRNHHHNKLTFSMMYAYSERYILPISHDEVVHVKGSVVNKMPGEYRNKFSGERALLGFMYAHPGKKLNFMGYEIAQFKEWDYTDGIDFYLTENELHYKMQHFVKSLNTFYKDNKPLYEIDGSWRGFEWLIVDDRFNNVIAFNRYDKNGDAITVIINFSGADLKDYRMGIVNPGSYAVVFCTDDPEFGGEGLISGHTVYSAKKFAWNNREYSIKINIPKLTCIYLKKEK